MLTFKSIARNPSSPLSKSLKANADYISYSGRSIPFFKPLITIIFNPLITIPVPISYLLPAVPSRGKQKTGICRRTTSPRWEQTIVWEDLSMEEVGIVTFVITINLGMDKVTFMMTMMMTIMMMLMTMFR